MLEALITSRTRIKMLLKFFTNSSSTAYLRGLAEEFNESTNSIRHELNNLSKAGYLISNENGRTVEYRANTGHPLFMDLKNLAHKYLGIDKIIENIVNKLGTLQAAYIIGDYASGKDSGTIELLLIGEIDQTFAKQLVKRAKTLVKRDIKLILLDKEQWEQDKSNHSTALLLWICD